jgi:hypothetical protein
MSGIRAVVVDPDAPNRLALADVEEPSPTPSETLVRVSAVSLSRGEALRFHPVPRSAGEAGLRWSRPFGANGRRRKAETEYRGRCALDGGGGDRQAAHRAGLHR